MDPRRRPVWSPFFNVECAVAAHSRPTLNLMGPFNSGWTEADVEAVLLRADPKELLYAPIVAGMNADLCSQGWAESVCLRLAAHPDFNVRGNAVLGFGHIARTCRELSLSRVLPVLSNALKDPHEFVRGHADSAASDLDMFMDVRVPGYDQAHRQELIDAIETLKHEHDI